MLMLLQHGHCTSVTILFGPFARLFFNLAMRIRALFSYSASILCLVEQAFWKVPLFHRTSWCKFLWGNLCRAIETFLPLGLLPLGLWVLDASLSFCCMKEFGDGFDCHFSTLIDIVTETAFVSSRTLPVGFPLPTVSWSPLSTLFCLLILLDHGACLIISIPGPKILISNVLLDTSFYHRPQSVIIRS